LGLGAPMGSVPKMSWMSFGNAAEYPMNEPKVMTQLCFSLKIANCSERLSRTVHGPRYVEWSAKFW